METTLGAGTDAAVTAGLAGSVHAHIRDAQAGVDGIETTLGAGTDAAVAGGSAGSVHAHIRHAQDSLATIAADVDDRAVGRLQETTYTNASLASNAGATTTHTCTTAAVRLTRLNLELLAAAHADLTSIVVTVARGGTTIRTLVDAIGGAAAVFTSGGLQADWEGSIVMTAGDLIVTTSSGTGAGTNSVKVYAECHSLANGGYLA
jgi:hypothetical protein